MIGAFAALLAFQLVGEILVRSLALPLPGPVVGMLLLFAALHLRGSLPADLQTTAQELLRYLSLLFVPAGVGVIAHIERIRSEWLPIGLTLILSTAITIAVTGGVMNGLIAWQQRWQRSTRDE